MRSYGKAVNTLSRNNRITERRNNRKAARQQGKAVIAAALDEMAIAPHVENQEYERDLSIAEYNDFHNDYIGIRGLDFDFDYVSPLPSFDILPDHGWWQIEHLRLTGKMPEYGERF